MKKIYKVANTDFSIMNLNKERFFTSYRKALDFINEMCGGINMVYIPHTCINGDVYYEYLYKEDCSEINWFSILLNRNLVINGSKLGHRDNRCRHCVNTYKIVTIEVE